MCRSHHGLHDGPDAPVGGRRFVRAPWLLLLTALAVRLAGAWWFRFHLNPDAGVAALMARHMAVGADWPVFFYGQAYMGSLEPAVSALFCRLLGVSGFAVALGPAFFSLLLLPVVYAWARGAAGKTAGLFAMAFCLVGPQGFFHYNHSPRGGYAATLFFCAACLWLSARIAGRFRQSGAVCPREFILLGLCAGLGWWTNQLIAPALLAAALLLLATLKWRVFSPPGWMALLAFLAGSAPFWWFNYCHGWPTFSFVNSFGGIGFRQGLKLFFVERFFGLIHIQAAPAWRWLHYAIVLAAGLMYAAALADRRRRSRRGADGLTGQDGRNAQAGCLQSMPANRAAAPFHQIIWLFAGVFALVFSASHFAAFDSARYLLPLIPALAVVFGAAMAWLAGRSRPAAWGITLLLLAAQAHNIAWARESMQADARAMARYDRLFDAATAAGKTNFMADYWHYGLNFMLAERALVADAGREKYPPFARRLEMADDICILGDYDQPSVFFARHGGSGRRIDFEGIPVHYDLRAPARHLQAVAAERIAYVMDSSGRDLKYLLTNGVVEHGWRSREQAKDDWIELGFATNQAVAMVRLFSVEREENPVCWRLEIQADAGAPWREIVPRGGFKHYYWSGNRLYAYGDHYRFEVFLPPGGVRKMRITNYASPGNWWWTVRGLQVFAPGPPQPDEAAAAPALCRLLRAAGVRRVYSDRYIANKLAALSGGELETLCDSYVTPRPRAEIGRVALGAQTAFVTRSEDAEMTRQALAQRLVEFRELRLPPWVVFAAEADAAPAAAGLYWTGFGLLLRGDENAELAVDWLRRARRRLDAGCADELTARLLRAALDAYPGCRRGAPRIAAAWLAGRTGAMQDALVAMTAPALAAPVRFQHGLELLGLDTERLTLSPGGTATLAYYWKAPAASAGRQYVMFVHFLRDNQIIFQDDHDWLEDFPADFLRRQPVGTVFMAVREIAVPADLRAGPLRLYCGIYDRATGRRLRPSTDLAQTGNGVFLPVDVRVE